MSNQITTSDLSLLKLWTAALLLINKVDTRESCSEEEEEHVGYLLDDMLQMILTAETTWEIRKIIIDQMLAVLVADNLIFTDTLLKMAERLCLQPEETRDLAMNLAQMSDPYYRHWALALFREIGDLERANLLLRDNLKHGDQYLSFAKLYEAKRLHSACGKRWDYEN